jgi:uncharacterized protein YjbI with pentapeptide repeats
MKKKVRQYVDELFAKYENSENVKDLKEFKHKLYAELSGSMTSLSKTGENWDLKFKKKVGSLSEHFSPLAKSLTFYKKHFKRDLLEKNYSSNIFNDADLKGIKGSKIFDACEMRNADLSDAVIPGSSFKCCMAHNSRFINADVSACDFSHADLQHADFAGADLRSSVFRCSHLENASFAGAILEDTSFVGISLKSVEFTNAKMVNTNFKYADLSDVNLEGLTLEGVNFTYADLHGTNMKNTILKDVIFKTDIKYVLFDGAKMDKITYALLKNNGAILANVTPLED